MSRFDVAIVGAGIAGASLAAELAPHRSVVLLEAEDQPGYHTTGRSAAFWSATYGGPLVAQLSAASRGWLERPPADYAETGFLAPRGELLIAREDEEAALDAHVAEFADAGIAFERLDAAALDRTLPGRRRDWTQALLQRDCTDIDVAGLHAAYLRRARRYGAELCCRARVERAVRGSNGWRIDTAGRAIDASVLVNAAGAWADDVAARSGAEPIGIAPLRRTIARVRLGDPVPADLPLVIAIDGSFYFKPDTGGRLWLSPHDETPSPPCDAAPEELDVAIAIDRFQNVVDWPVEAVEHSWAGLRSFAPDRLPVYGFDPRAEGFYWFAGQGGFGIQTAPAAAHIAAAQLLGVEADRTVESIDATRFAPGRFSHLPVSY
jgi:D-arginine dehydrogenase